MTKRTLWVVGAALLGLAGCAHESAKVSDEQLARVPPAQMQPVYQQRDQVSKANDALSRQQIRVKEAQNELSVAQNDKSVADAEMDRAKSALEAAQYARDQQRTRQAQNQLQQAQQKQQLAQLHIDAAQGQLDYANARADAAQKQVSVAQSALELEEFQAIQKSGDPAAKELNGNEIQKKLEQARADYRNAQNEAMQQRDRYQSVRQRYEQAMQRGIGGAGQGGQNQIPQGDNGQ